jgi:hypothetical protein
MGPALGRPDKLRDQAIEAIEQRGCLLRCKTEAGPFRMTARLNRRSRLELGCRRNHLQFATGALPFGRQHHEPCRGDGTAVSGNSSIVTAPVTAYATKSARARLQYGCIARVAAMFWIYWDTLWSLFFSAVWFMTIVSHPDAEVTATWRDRR